MPPTVYIIAGPNGAGKTTFARAFLPDFVNCWEFLNADLLAAGLSPLAPEAAAVRAGRLLLSRMRELIAEKQSFGFETTLAGRSYLSILQEMKKQGYLINIFFLWLPDAEMAIDRVAQRVAEAGHDIPQDVIRRRFDAGLRNFFGPYHSLFDGWTLFDNAALYPLTVARNINGSVEIADESKYTTVLHAVS